MQADRKQTDERVPGSVSGNRLASIGVNQLRQSIGKHFSSNAHTMSCNSPASVKMKKKKVDFLHHLRPTAVRTSSWQWASIASNLPISRKSKHMRTAKPIISSNFFQLFQDNYSYIDGPCMNSGCGYVSDYFIFRRDQREEYQLNLKKPF
jgi:hypothetical protein